MIDKLGGTALLLNGQAVTFIAQGKYAEAETALGEALEKDPNNPETLVNLVVLAQHQGKSQEQATRLLSQLKDLEPGHPFLQVVYINHFPLLLFRKKTKRILQETIFTNEIKYSREWSRRKPTLTGWFCNTALLREC